MDHRGYDRRNAIMSQVSDEKDALYLRQLSHWESTGVFARITAAHDAGTEVFIVRSSGERQACVLHYKSGGFGGLLTGVRWGESDDPSYKGVDTEDFIAWNPELFAGIDDPLGPTEDADLDPVPEESAEPIVGRCVVAVREKVPPGTMMLNADTHERVYTTDAIRHYPEHDPAPLRLNTGVCRRCRAIVWGPEE